MIKQTKAIIGFVTVAILVAGGLLFYNRQKLVEQAFQPTDSSVPQASQPSEQIVAENLNIPWEIVFLPDDSMLVTERPGTLRHVSSGNVTNVEGVAHRGEGGLLGMALHPDFKNNRYIYLYSTTAVNGGLSNRVERYQYADNKLTDRKTIIEGIPGASNHDGGRIAFGPDGLLYITTGDAENTSNAQNQASLAGKILRLRDDGSVPADNPFGTPVYSYGHRNPQGLTWDSSGQLWATEHGRSGLRSGFDELNKIVKGANYGWPTIEGDKTQAGLTPPTIHSGANDTWAPGGLAFYNGHLIFVGLRGQALYSATIENGTATNLLSHLKNKYGRLRAVVPGPDGYLYISTSNRDGRGSVQQGDDKIIRVKLNLAQ